MSTIEREYRKLRSRGYRAENAIRNARTKVRLRMVPDEEQYDDSYLDTWGESEKKVAESRKKLWEQIEREGVWGLVGEYLDASGRWEEADSVWGIIGDDDDYYPQIKQAALDAYDRECVEEARSLGARATFAGVSP